MWNTKFARYFFPWSTLGIKPQNDIMSPTPYPLGHMLSLHMQSLQIMTRISICPCILIVFSVFADYTKRLQDFTVRVGNSSNIDYHFDICAFHPGYIQASGRAVLPCDGKVARYLSIVNSRNHWSYYNFYLCEVIIIGAVAAGKHNKEIVVMVS